MLHEVHDLDVCVLGLGAVGLPTALYIRDRGLNVYGYDISEKAVKRAASRGLRATVRWDDIPACDVYVICVSTLLKDDGSPDMDPVFDVCEKISGKMKRSSLISIESTIVPGTCRKVYNEILNRKGFLVHVPHRYWEGDPINYGVRQTRVIGGINDVSLEKGIHFYGRVLDIPLHMVSEIEVAELCKVAENAYRYVQIAFAEELKMICKALKLDFEEVREACNTKWNIEILEARKGIGGHCLPKDVRYFIHLKPDLAIISRAAIKADEIYRKKIVKGSL